MKTIKPFLMAFLAIMWATLDGAGSNVPRPENKRVLCLGDSITHGGYCLYYLQLMENLRHPGSTTRYYNAGHSGGRVKDCIREDYVFELARVNPDLVMMMFGMNDVGGAHYSITDTTPPSDELMAEINGLDADYRENYTNLIEHIKAKGVSDMILITPSPYDEYSTGLSSLPRYWFDRIGLTLAAESVRTVAAEKSLPTIDLHGPMADIIQRYPKICGETETKGWCGPDRVHPQRLGHLFMAMQYLKAFGETAPVARIALTADGTVIQRENAVVSNVRKDDEVLSFDYAPNALPFPKLEEYDLLKTACPEIETTFNCETLKVTGLSDGFRWHVLADGRPLGVFTKEELAQGVNLAELDTPNARRANEAAAVMTELHDYDVKLRDRRLDDIHAEMRETVFGPDELARQESYYQAMASVRPGCERIEIRPCWFDANIPQYAEWSADAALAEGGAWTAGTKASGVATLDDDGALGIEGLSVASFQAAEGRSLTTDVNAVTVSSTIDAGVFRTDEFPVVESGAKGGVLIATDGAGRFYYCGLVKGDAQNVWAELEGPAAPSDGRPVCVRLTLAEKAGGIVVTYVIDGVTYAYGGETEIPVVAGDFGVTAVNYSGLGSVYTLAADTQVPDPSELAVRKITKADDGKTPVSVDITYGAADFARTLYVCWGRDCGTTMADWAQCRQLGVVSPHSVKMTATIPDDIRSDLVSRGFRLFIGYTTAKDYVQTGLVALYDCRENVGWNTFNGSATVWRNLVSDDRDTDLTLNTAGTPPDKSETDNVHLANSIYRKSTKAAIASEGDTISMEFNMKPPTTTGVEKWFAVVGGLGRVGFRGGAGTLEVGHPQSNGKYCLRWFGDLFPTDSTYHTYTAKDFNRAGSMVNKAWLDGVRKNQTGEYGDGGNTTDTDYKFKLGFDNQVNLDLRSVRIYAKSLTMDEISQNRAVDVSRFEGGAPIHCEASAFTRANKIGVFIVVE